MLKSHCTLQARYVNIVQNDFALKQKSKVTLLLKFFFVIYYIHFPLTHIIMTICTNSTLTCKIIKRSIY